MGMEKLQKRINIATGKLKADLVIKNCKVVNVYTKEIIEGDIAISDEEIAGVGNYEGVVEVDAKGKYALPGFIESHIHIESSMVTPEEFGRLVAPCGTTTAICDPHEIVNVAGFEGLKYMMEAAKNTAVDLKFMLPSCVPTSTEWETSGAVITAEDMEEMINHEQILGLGEFMNAVGVINTDESVLKKIMVAKKAGKPVDGHAPGISGKAFTGYATTGIRTDHECGNLEEMREHLRNGLYVMLRYGTVCKELPENIKAVTEGNSRRILLCSDDRQATTMVEKGDLDYNLALCVENGIDPVTAVTFASLNAAECYGLSDRGAIAPGLRADIVLVEDLEKFEVKKVWIKGELVAEDKKYLKEFKRADASKVKSSIHVKDFSKDKLKMNLKSNKVNTIDLTKGTVLSTKGIAEIELTPDGDFIYNPSQDAIKMAVIERHKNTGNVATAIVRNYGLKKGAIALSISHDAHNIIAAGVSNDEIAFAVEELMKLGGGIIIVNEGKILESMPLPVGGLMSDQTGEWVREKIVKLNKLAFDLLGINKELDPVMTLCFMSLCVIPEIKLTDKGLFDVTKFEFITNEA